MKVFLEILSQTDIVLSMANNNSFLSFSFSRIVRESAKATCFGVDSDAGEIQVWLPKSCSEIESTEDGSAQVTFPSWILTKNRKVATVIELETGFNPLMAFNGSNYVGY